jgi:hypothetical protein
VQWRGKHTYITIEELLEKVFSVEAALRLYREDLRQLRGELRESLETAVEDDGEEKTWCVRKWFVKCSNKLYKCNKSGRQSKIRL